MFINIKQHDHYSQTYSYTTWSSITQYCTTYIQSIIQIIHTVNPADQTYSHTTRILECQLFHSLVHVLLESRFVIPNIGLNGFMTPIYDQLYSDCGDTVKRIALELGGNAPFIVFKVKHKYEVEYKYEHKYEVFSWVGTHLLSFSRWNIALSL